jgi:hypothetical protein
MVRYSTDLLRHVYVTRCNRIVWETVQGRGGHFLQLHDLPPGADWFLCVAEDSDCTSVFSTLQLHDLDQVSF